MSDSLKVCPACQTVNQDSFRFCKNCGTPLTTPAAPPPPPPQAQGYVVNEIDGVPVEHVSAYIGKKQKILDKFIQIQLTGGKSTWCWPVFLLGFFFSFVGASLWFFYRKVYKPAVALLISGLVVAGGTFAMSFPYLSKLGENMSSVMQAAEQFANNEITYQQYMSQVYGSMFTKEYLMIMAVSLIVWILQVVAAILLAMFAFNLYKKSAIGNIKAFALKNDREIYPYELQAIGGTSPVAVVLVVVGYFVLYMVLEFAFIIPSMSSMFSALESYK